MGMSAVLKEGGSVRTQAEQGGFGRIVPWARDTQIARAIHGLSYDLI